MDSKPLSYAFRGLDGYTGFRAGQPYQLTPDPWDDGSGTVTVGMLNIATRREKAKK